jgi:hypothetical protein
MHFKFFRSKFWPTLKISKKHEKMCKNSFLKDGSIPASVSRLNWNCDLTLMFLFIYFDKFLQCQLVDLRNALKILLDLGKCPIKCPKTFKAQVHHKMPL